MCDKIPARGRLMTLGILALFLSASGCQPDDSPFKTENEVLRRQVAKQESLLNSLQDSNRVMQQQIDLLNQELRDSKEAATRLNEELNERLANAKRMLTLNLRIDDKGAQFETLARPLGIVAKEVEEALSRNGYQLKVGTQTDQKAVYVTTRKVSNPTSLEVAGFRNQYLVSLQAFPGDVTKLGVKAEFEKLAQGGRILNVSAEETAEIELRLINEINTALASPGKR